MSAVFSARKMQVLANPSSFSVKSTKSIFYQLDYFYTMGYIRYSIMICPNIYFCSDQTLKESFMKTRVASLLVGIFIVGGMIQMCSEPLDPIPEPTTTTSSSTNTTSIKTTNTTTTAPTYTTTASTYHYPPLVYITKPEYNGYAGASMDFTGYVDSPEQLDLLEYRFGTDPYIEIPFDENLNFSKSLSAMIAGAHLLEVRATTVSGLTGSYSVLFNVDNTNPTILIDEPAQGRYVHGIVHMYGTASDTDGTGIHAVYISIDGGDPLMAEGKEEWSYVWDSSSDSIGDHSIMIWSVDKVNNSSTPQSRTITIGDVVDVADYLNTTAEQPARQPDITNHEESLYVAYEELNANGFYEIVVKKYEEPNWVPVGGPVSDPTKNALNPSIAIKVDEPVVVYREFESSTGYRLRVRHWVDPNWELMGGDLNETGGTAWEPEIVGLHDGNKQPYVVFSELSSGKRVIYCKVWNGTDSWTLIGGTQVGCDIGTNCYHPSVDRIGDQPMVTFQQNNSPTSDIVRVRYFEGSSWKTYGTNVFYDPSADAYDPKITAYSDIPYISWTEVLAGVGTRQVRVARWSGTTWELVGSSLNVDYQRDAFDPDLVFLGGKPYVAFREQIGDIFLLFVKSYANNLWEPIGGHYWNLSHNRTATHHALTSTTKPYVTFMEMYGSEESKVRVRTTSD